MIAEAGPPEGVCAVCGGAVETAGHEICYGCHLDRLVPYGYQNLEAYEYVCAFLHPNATAHPPTGVPILDDRSAPMVREMCLRTKRTPHLRG